MWRYHAPRGLEFQDYQRLSRDGMAYLLRDFDILKDRIVDLLLCGGILIARICA